jgi:hypothetical protein
VQAKPASTQAYKKHFESARKNAEVVASVRVLAAVCTRAKNDGGSRKLTLQLCLQVKKVAKGPPKKGEVLVVTHPITWSSRKGPSALYARLGTLHSFPCVAGASGEVALRWDARKRCYVSVAGWVPDPPDDSPPTEAGRATVAAGAPAPK